MKTKKKKRGDIMGKKLKVIRAEPEINYIVVEINNIPNQEQGDYPKKLKKGLINCLIRCTPEGRPITAIHIEGCCGSGMWDNLFSKKTQKLLKKICKEETKKYFKKNPSKINLKKYGGWY